MLSNDQIVGLVTRLLAAAEPQQEAGIHALIDWVLDVAESARGNVHIAPGFVDSELSRLEILRPLIATRKLLEEATKPRREIGDGRRS